MEKVIDKQLTRIIYSVDKNKVKVVLSDKKLGSGVKLTLLNLIDRLYGKNDCFPSEPTIAEDIGLTVESVKKHVAILKACRYIKVKRGGINPYTGKSYSSNTYDLSYFLKPKTVPVKSKEANQDETEG